MRAQIGQLNYAVQRRRDEEAGPHRHDASLCPGSFEVGAAEAECSGSWGCPRYRDGDPAPLQWAHYCCVLVLETLLPYCTVLGYPCCTDIR